MSPLTTKKHADEMRKPALCELLPVREYLDGVMVQVDGSLVAGYELTGLNSFYHDDEMRNRSKHSLEALIRSLPERSMRLQMRFEIAEGIGAARAEYPRLQRNESAVLQEIDRGRMARWDERSGQGYYLRHILHAYFIWNPRIHHELAERLQGKKASRIFSFSAEKCIERARREHEDLLSEFSSLLAGVEQTLVATDMGVRRMSDDDMFLEAKRGLNPVFEDRSAYRRRRARAAGFVIEMRYLALRDFALHLERIKARADAGGHAASETTLRQIYHSSLANLAQAVAEADQIWVYDNGKTGGPPLLVLEAEAGVIHFLAEDLPPWLVEALHL